jgi:hypothetical protein
LRTPPRAARTTTTGTSQRVESRREFERPSMQLEDDPRGNSNVSPVMQNGRAGLGMRF